MKALPLALLFPSTLLGAGGKTKIILDISEEFSIIAGERGIKEKMISGSLTGWKTTSGSLPIWWEVNL